ncbi:Manganese/iron superoxide dismutase [Cokeromyces recurvatus]|uniref:Manganese/iron superoxide dismutase n=1 Tax=Cokeromyces recurvatus TaxID=90255 RepID=UPI00221ED21D|nr:Manganese/iron superoxide dismutase [Cokeromyces recurvatus]KAI7903706.1 Manganese/iron superoxide dismutase [Cokeromyces recurvatus]
MISSITAAAAKPLLKSSIKPIAFRAISLRFKATLPKLPYSYDALEPYISSDIMEVHHSKHHQTYINNFNQAEEKYKAAVEANDLMQQLAIQNSLKFNGGGHLNHSIYWENLAPKKEGGGKVEEAGQELLSAIQKEFGSFDEFIKRFNTVAAGIQGSGWAWLAFNKETNRVEIAASQNQDTLPGFMVPLLAVDVWEHAYYLQYKNVRADYLKQIWEVIHWKTVAERFAKAQQ